MPMRTTCSNNGAFERLRLVQCYQCGKCSAGCPVAEQMDLLPNQLIRLIQIGHLDRALECEAIWRCVSCMTCSTRCPQSVDCAGIMDLLREESVKQGKASPQRLRTVLFQRAFLDNIRRNGRLGEVELIRVFKTGAFIKDRRVSLLFDGATLAPALMKRKKLHIRGERVKDRGVVDRIFQKCRNETSQ